MGSYSSWGTLIYAGYEIKNGRFYNFDGTLASSSSSMILSFSKNYAYFVKVSNGSSVQYYIPGESSFPSLMMLQMPCRPGHLVQMQKELKRYWIIVLTELCFPKENIL